MNKQIPEWVKSSVFYQIFPDRFYKGKLDTGTCKFESWNSPQTTYGFKGGNLIGIIEKIDYLCELGINAIYLNPIFTSCANHRYHTYDYFSVDPMLGGNDALRKLLDVAHSKGIKIILDGVFNHCSRGFFQFNHLLENGESSPYKDWFHVKSFPLRSYNLAKEEKANYECWYDLPALPKFNTDNKDVRKMIFDVAKYWLEFGIDGWRLDVPNEIDDDDFWIEFRKICKSVNPDCYIVGEIWDDATRWLKGNMFDAVMNYLLPAACMRYFAGEKLKCTHEYGKHEFTPINEKEFKKEINKIIQMYDWNIVLSQMNIFGTHDTDRMLYEYGDDKKLMKLALVFSFFFPGVPNIYYGEEIGLAGTLENGTRQTMPWNDKSIWDEGLFELYKKCIKLRKDKKILADGDFEFVEINGNKEKDFIIYRRFFNSNEDSNLYIILNKNNEARNVELNIKTKTKASELVFSKKHEIQCKSNDEDLTVKMQIEEYGFSVLLA